MTRHSFAPAAPEEEIVYGACRPGYPSENPESSAVQEWLAHMRDQDIERVCCLLADTVDAYDGLIEMYRGEFGSQNVRHAPVDDYDVVAEDTFHDVILPFLREAADTSEKVVVHCSAGMGRTGHVLVLWLVYGRNYGLEQAIETVQQTGRSPLEAASRERLRQICSLSS